MQLAISTEVDFFWPLTGEDQPADANKQDLSFESFEKDIGEIELDWSFQQFHDNFSNFRDTLPVITTPSSLTYSTESESEPALSQYSYGFVSSSSEYSIPSEIAIRGQAEHGIHAIHDAICSDVVSNDPSSFGPLPPFPPSHPIEAHSDYGISDPYRPFFDISPEELPLALQQSTTNATAALHSTTSVQDGQTRVPPVKPYRCTLCSYGKADPNQNL